MNRDEYVDAMLEIHSRTLRRLVGSVGMLTLWLIGLTLLVVL